MSDTFRRFVVQWANLSMVAIAGVDVAFLLSRPFNPWTVASLGGCALYLFLRRDKFVSDF